VYGQKVVKFWNSLLERVHTTFKYSEPLGDSAEAEYTHPPKVKYLDYKYTKYSTKYSLAVIHQNPK